MTGAGKRLAVVLLTLAAIAAAVFTAAPPALAYHDTGWHDHQCAVTEGTIIVDIRVEWYTPDNHRFWMMWAYARDRAGRIHPVDTATWWVTAIGGSWVIRRTQRAPDVYTTQWFSYTPGLRPWQWHYFLNRASWNGAHCQSQTVLS